MPDATSLVELRVLDGPNLYFPRAAIKLVLDVGPLIDLDSADAAALASAVGLAGARTGGQRTGQRQRFAITLVARVVRRLAAASGTARLGLRVRPGAERHEIVVAFPWRRHDRAVAMAEGVATCVDALPSGDIAHCVAQQAVRIAATPAGRRPSAIRPRIPVASITGTNGKTTTTRLVAHLAMTAGMRTGWSSTDGVLVQGELIEPGDYSGPAGARAVLEAPGVQCAVLETARGGLLLRGMGVVSNDVSVVTNVSADHLGQQGIDTVDQLAEVKAIITRVTVPGGWCVLNGDDPRVLAMAARTPARPWVFSLDPGSPALRSALDVGGRGITVLDGQIVVLGSDADPSPLVDVVDVPLTLCGLSTHNVANALAASAAGLGLGLPREAVTEGLRTFVPDVQLNPGRLNLWSLPVGAGAVTVVIDLAHNEAGLEALLDVSVGLRAPGSVVRLALGTAGDRTDDILRSLGRVAGRRADQVVIVHKQRYLRGRSAADMEQLMSAGLADVGVAGVPAFDDELAGLQALAAAAQPGDVVAVMCHADRPALDEWLTAHGATADGPPDVRRKVLAARGEHPHEALIRRLWSNGEPAERNQQLRQLLDADPSDPRLQFEWASAFDADGHEALAVPTYRAALDGGLREPHRTRALIQLASSLTVLGQAGEAVQLLDDVVRERPTSVAAQGFLALALRAGGRADDAFVVLLRALLQHASDPDDNAYAAALSRYAGGIATP